MFEVGAARLVVVELAQMSVDALLQVFVRRFNIYEPGDCLRVAVARRAKQSNQTRQQTTSAEPFQRR